MILSTYLCLFLPIGPYSSDFPNEIPNVSLFSLLTLQCQPRCTVQAVIYDTLLVSVHCTVVNAFKGITNLKETQCKDNVTL